MIFTSVGRAIAKFAIMFALFRIGVAVLVLTNDNPIVTASSLLGSQTTGQAIDLAI